MTSTAWYRLAAGALGCAAAFAVLRWLWVRGLRALRTFVRALWPHS